MKKILILGATGMLGHTVSRYFTDKLEYEVYCTYRSDMPGRSFRFDALKDEPSFPQEFDYVINCIGLIKQRTGTSDNEFYKVNAELPKRLVNNCKAKVIHITTDCVFSGKKGNYVESDAHDPVDVYGISKSAGECPGCMRLRTSIIGQECMTKLGLLEFVRNAPSPINGFANHRWNGITTLQYAKLCDKIIKEDLWIDGLRHVFSNQVSKYDLVSTINRVYCLGKDIVKYIAPIDIDRTLSSEFPFCENVSIPPIDKQIEELYEY